MQYNLSLNNGTFLFLNNVVSVHDGCDEMGDYVEIDDKYGNQFIVYQDNINSMVRVIQPVIEVMQ